ncbi:MAG TPA: class I SAM-dependent methyltransferase [Anaerolineales bacterium]|nr:class I SAM-dependent methyltransferase [Anaerolineales bacterium]
MKSTIAAKLIQLNREFYQTFARQFSNTRMRLQPGVMQIINRLPPNVRLLDLGCGNGELARELGQRGFDGIYVGLDSSESLISIARQRFDPNYQAIFLNADLSTLEWDKPLKTIPDLVLRPPYDRIFAFAVLHHLPGNAIREQLFQKIRTLLSANGHFIHSEWQFLNSPRLRKRIQPWERAGLNALDVDPGDFLLDWRQGGSGLRYVHHFSLEELQELASRTGFDIRETFYSDGEGGNLAIYQVWEPI